MGTNYYIYSNEYHEENEYVCHIGKRYYNDGYHYILNGIQLLYFLLDNIGNIIDLLDNSSTMNYSLSDGSPKFISPNVHEQSDNNINDIYDKLLDLYNMIKNDNVNKDIPDLKQLLVKAFHYLNDKNNEYFVKDEYDNDIDVYVLINNMCIPDIYLYEKNKKRYVGGYDISANYEFY